MRLAPRDEADVAGAHLEHVARDLVPGPARDHHADLLRVRVVVALDLGAGRVCRRPERDRRRVRRIGADEPAGVDLAEVERLGLVGPEEP